RLKMFNTLAEYGRLNPDKIIRDTVIIDGEMVPISDYSSRAPIPVIAFGDTRTKSDLLKYKCYSRSNSFGAWERGTSIISANVLMSNNPTINANSFAEVSVSKSRVSDQKNSLIEEWSHDFLEYYSIIGMQISVSLNKNMLFSKGFGYSDFENEKFVNSQTRFRIASVSKSITSAAIINLVSDGKLDLDLDVRRYVPSFPTKRDSLTSRQLAGHLGGIRDYYEISLDELFGNPHFHTATEAISIFKEDTLMSEPGTDFLYSSYGYDLLGAVIEGASGESYLDYMQYNIWEPLLMSNTYGDISDSIMINKSKFYYPNEHEAKPYDLSYGYPSGGLISTTEDLLIFGNELLYGDYFDEKLKNKLFESQYTIDKKLTNYGLGWFIGKDFNGHSILYHVGELPSSGAVLILYPDDGIVISLLSNTPILTNALNGLPLEVQKLAAAIYKENNN
ncbi:MAG: serine hydrolase domain-containing protein, partial [Nonlabens ulvanivorans]